MLQNARIATRLPVADLGRSRDWYAKGAGPRTERGAPRRPHLPLCRGEFALFESAGSASGESTQMAFEVEDLDAEVEELRRRGLEFENVQSPGFSTQDGIATIDGNYPSVGIGERAAWFRDCDGNLLGIGQPLRAKSAGER